MQVPGSNLLAIAATVITQQTVQYLAFAGRTVDPSGLFVNTYAEPVDIRGSFQDVQRAAYVQNGLDLSKSYKQLYAIPQVFDVERGISGDRIVYGGRLYEAVGNANWNLQDGWQGTLFVDIGAANGN